MDHLKQNMGPGMRGAFYYSIFWSSVAAFDPFLNVHYNRIGISGIDIGWLSMLLPLFILVLSPFVSRLADKFAIRVKLLTVLLLAFSGLLMLYSFPKTFAEFLPIVILVSIIRCSTSSLGDSIIARMASKYQIDYGHMRFWGSLLFFISCLGLGVLWTNLGFKYMFFAAGLLFIPTAFAAALLEETPNEALPLQTQPSNLEGFSLFIKDKSLILLTIATFFVIGSLTMAGNFIGIYMEKVGGNETYIGALWGFSALFEVPTMIFSGKIIKKIGYSNTLVCSYILSAAGLLGYSISNTPILLVIFACIRGLGFGLLFVNTVMIIDRRAPAKYATTFQGIISSLAWGLSPLLAGPLSGLIFEKYGPDPLFIFCGLIAIAACLLLIPTYFLWSNKTVFE